MADLSKFQVAYGGRRIEYGLELDPRFKHDNYIIYHCKGIYEPEVLWVFLHVLKPGDVAIDVGANIGFHTLFMSRIVGENGRVIALEPLDENRRRLERNLEINEVRNVTVYDQPAWKHCGVVSVYKSIDDPSSSCVGWNPGLWVDNPETAKLKPKPVRIEAVTLDSLNVKPKLIKIDIEGGEFNAMLGARNTLTGGPIIVSELNPFGMKQLKYTDEDYRAYMREFGYDLFLLYDVDAFPTLIPPKVKIKYGKDVGVKNVMFAYLDTLHEYWSQSQYEAPQ